MTDLPDRALAALGQVLRLQLAADPRPLDELALLDERTLYREHWLARRPVVFRGAASGWASASWSFPELRAQYRWAPVDVSRRSARWWLEDRDSVRMPFGEMVDRVLGAPSDAWYCDGRSGLLDQAGLAPLRADLGLLPGLAGDGHPRAWMGPAHTVTPTHHDQASAWLVQVLGCKRLYLASPLEPALATTARGLFHPADPRSEPPRDLAEVRWHRVDLGPGDALFTPVGWWHHVEALEPSFSVSFSGFRWPNAFPWYVPGAA